MNDEDTLRTDDKPGWSEIVLLVLAFSSVISQAVQGNWNAAITIAILAYLFADAEDWSRRWRNIANSAIENSLRATMTAALMKSAYDALKAKTENHG